MSPEARTLAWRLAVAVVLAGAALAGLWWWTTANDAAAAAAAAAVAEQRRVETAPGPIERLGYPLAASTAPIHVAASLAAVAPDVAPVIEVLADGSLALRRAPGPAAGPLAGPRPAAVLVPRSPLAAWTPAARAAFAAAVGALSADRPVPAGQVRIADAPIAAAELAALLTWVR